MDSRNMLKDEIEKKINYKTIKVLLKRIKFKGKFYMYQS